MRRWISFVAVALPAVVLIWLIVPLNNFLLCNALIADDYLMPASSFVILAVVLGINPLLRLFSLRLVLNRSQLALLYGVVMVAALVPSGGLLRQSLHPLARTVYRANTDPMMAEAYKVLAPPPSLYPDKLELGADIPAVESFIDQLGDDQPVPWRAWLRPMMAWMGFIGPWFLMMTATSVIFFGYWRDTERTPFPLLGVLQALVDAPDDGRRLPRIFRSRQFWTACGIVFVIQGMTQAHAYFPSAVPAFPLRWNLDACFTEFPLRHIGWWMRYGTIYFTFLGISYFMPRRISFSIWFFQVAYALYIMIREAYLPPFMYSQLGDHSTGAFVVFPIFILWLARRHLLRVARATLRLVRTTGEDRAYGVAGCAFVAGLTGMFVWLLWVRVPPPLAALLSLAAFFYALTLTRVLAETGLPLFFPDTGYLITLVRLVPTAWRTAAGMYFSGVLAVWFGPGQRVCVGTVVAQAMGLNRDDKPRQHVRLGGLFMIVLLLSVVGAGLVHLHIGYRNASTIDGRPIAWWGCWQFDTAENLLMETVRGTVEQNAAEHVPHLVFGGLLTALLYTLCQLAPQWPLHPVGLLCVGTWSVCTIWPNVFLGWLAKGLILKYGGSRLHRKAGDVFIGFILGEVFAMAFWCLFAALRASLGMDYHFVNIMPN